MATNKNAVARYHILDKCFSNPGRRYFYDTLSEEINKMLQDIDPGSKGISRRQVEMDIAFMESKEGYNIELQRLKEGKKIYFRYTDTSFSINNMPLNDLEVNQLQSAVNILSQFKGMPQFEWMQEILLKLNQGMEVSKEQQTVMAFENNENLVGTDYLGTLYNAIHYKEPLLISYKHFYAEVPEDLIIHPYHLKQYNSRWFLFGLNTANNNPTWNMALDRIENIANYTAKYIQNETVNWDDYFEDVIGVTVPSNEIVEEIRLLFFGITGKYVKTKPLHGSQKSYPTADGNLEVHLKLKINFELEKLLLSFGETVQVLQPPSLVEKMKTRLEQAGDRY